MKENSHYRSRRKRRHSQKEIPTFMAIDIPELFCHLCRQKISDVTTAISYGSDQEPAHFDCVLAELVQKISLKLNERIVYLGSGFFGVIIEKENHTFELRQRLLMEDQTNLPSWRKQIRNLYKFL